MTKKEMNAIIQNSINGAVESELQYFEMSKWDLLKVVRLRSCSAIVREYVNKKDGNIIYCLVSYETIVAIIDGNACYDFLRKVYGYTATSAQHISKFAHDFGAETTLRYYPL